MYTIYKTRCFLVNAMFFFNLKTRTGSLLLTPRDLTLVAGMAAMITGGRNQETLKLYF